MESIASGKDKESVDEDEDELPISFRELKITRTKMKKMISLNKTQTIDQKKRNKLKNTKDKQITALIIHHEQQQ